MIIGQNISKAFEKEKVLDNVSLRVGEGSIYGLLGSNGAGKTTLLKILSGIIGQDDGEVTLNGQQVFENPSVKSEMLFLSDALYFLPQYSVSQMASYFAEMYPTWNEERYKKLKELFGLNTKKKIGQFSKGMQRQVAFWLALSATPKYLILDEPFDGLDPVIRRRVKNLLIQDVAERGMSILISSHNLREVEDICDYVGILHRGTLLLERDLDDLKSDVHKVQVAYKGDADESIWGDLDILHKETRGSVLLFIVRGNEAEVTARFKSHHPVVFDLLPLTLEEIFVYEMGGAGYAIENILV
ncbi:ABC transporter ATP-binding protein [Sediminibacillus massiliensis]|uniref:ABC transporter ATP-binding protein n=1 Tax=Sediminibacillus massiliensis TaxID=1926277 RepID=UPI00098867C8|nr:ABC transporter ATP-binding protein [Sediminibacillus massiliensis]